MQEQTALDKDQLTVEDIIAEANNASYHTILEVWREVLKPAKGEISKRITPQWATRIVNQFPGITYADMPVFRERYFGKILHLASILDDEIAQDDECLNLVSAEEDVESNTSHYLNVLFAWQMQFMQWEIEWDSTADDAAIEIAALSEVHKMFFDPQGLTALLDQINFQFTDTDRDTLGELLAGLIENADSFLAEDAEGGSE
jgi:hypothetical protein